MVRYLILLTLIASCSVSPKNDDLPEDSLSADIKTIIFKSEYGGFGYDIEMNGKLLVHQPNVPVIANYRGFATEQEAQKIAALVVLKLKNNEIPPALTPLELGQSIKKP